MKIKRLMTWLGILIIGCVVIFLAGPRVKIDTRLRSISLPQNLDQHLTESEAKFKDIVPGAEKTIIWAGNVGAQTPLSIIYFHGFSATRQETAPLSEIVAKRLGANLFYTRFTGHGRNSNAMMEGNVNAWLNDAYEAIEIGRRIGKKVIVIGVSTGGTTATWLATTKMAEYISAVVLLSPNFAPADPKSRFLLWPWGGHMAEFIIGPEYSWEPSNEGHGKYWTHRYPTRALLPMMGLVNLVDSLDMSSIKAPVLAIYSPTDQVVSARKIETMVTKIGSAQKRLIPYAESENPIQHVIAGDILSPGSTKAIAEMIIEFIYAGKQGG